MENLITLTPSAAKTTVALGNKFEVDDFCQLKCECIGDVYMLNVLFDKGSWSVGSPYSMEYDNPVFLGSEFKALNENGTLKSESTLKEEFTTFIFGWVKWFHERGHEKFDAENIEEPTTVWIKKSVKCLTVRTEIFVTINDLIDHVVHHEKDLHEWSENSLIENKLPNIDDYTYLQVMRITKYNLRNTGRKNFVPDPEFSGDKHNTWFQNRYKIELKKHLFNLFPELEE